MVLYTSGDAFWHLLVHSLICNDMMLSLQVICKIDKNPLATASIGQVHRGQLCDGTDVVIKVQRQGMEELMNRDMTDMLRVMQMLDDMGLDLKFDHLSILKEYKARVPDEFDFLKELKHINKAIACIERNMNGSMAKDFGFIHLPTPFPDLCTREVLVMSYLNGETLTNSMRKQTNFSFSQNSSKVDLTELKNDGEAVEFEKLNEKYSEKDPKPLQKAKSYPSTTSLADGLDWLKYLSEVIMAYGYMILQDG